MRILTLFLDGIGLGDDDPAINPFAAANTPNMRGLSNGKRWLKDTGWQASERAVFIPTDARLDVPGIPQSGTGQASLVTGLNAPKLVGRHYGPKPDARTRKLIAEHSYFRRLVDRGQIRPLADSLPRRFAAQL